MPASIHPAPTADETERLVAVLEPPPHNLDEPSRTAGSFRGVAGGR